jgi:hypothetical protein
VKQIQIVQIQESAVAGAGADTTAAPVASHGKIILSGKKPKHMKIVLTKKNHGLAAPQLPVADSASSAYRPRKVTLGLQHLKRRVTKARRLQRILKATPIEQIRKELVAAKIIKPDSKAPEAILRQMYSDAKLVSTKSL